MHSKWGSQKPGCAIPLCFQKTPRTCHQMFWKPFMERTCQKQGIARAWPIWYNTIFLWGPLPSCWLEHKASTSQAKLSPKSRRTNQLKPLWAPKTNCFRKWKPWMLMWPRWWKPQPWPKCKQCLPRLCPCLHPFTKLHLRRHHCLCQPLMPMTFCHCRGSHRMKPRLWKNMRTKPWNSLQKHRNPKERLRKLRPNQRSLKARNQWPKLVPKRHLASLVLSPRLQPSLQLPKEVLLPKASLVQRQHLPTGSCTVASKDAFAAGGPPKDATVVFLQTLVASGCLEEMPGKNGSKPDKGLKGETILPNHTSLVALGLQPLFSCVVWKPEKHHDVWMLCLMMFEKRSCWVFGPAILEPSIGDICCEVTMTKKWAEPMHFAYLLKIHWQPKHAIHAWPAWNFAFLTIAFFTKAFNVSFFPSAAPNASLSTQCFLEHPVLPWAPSAFLGTQCFLFASFESFLEAIYGPKRTWVSGSNGGIEMVRPAGGGSGQYLVTPQAKFFFGHQSIVAKFFFDYGYGNLARLARMGRSQWLHHDCCKSHRQPWDASQSRSNKSFGAKPSRLVHTGWKNQNVTQHHQKGERPANTRKQVQLCWKSKWSSIWFWMLSSFPSAAHNASLSTQCFLEHPVLLFHCKSKELFYIATLQVHRYWHTYIFSFMWFHVHPKKSTNSFSF